LCENAVTGLSVADLVEQFGISRSTLDRWCREYLGHSAHEELHRVRLDRIRQLLAESSLTLAEIARRTGFKHHEHLARSFRNLTGQTPGQYRAAMRLGE
jgi:LacI family transcriptional regulator